MIRCDVAVVGGGAMGTATAWWLARRGRDVVLLEQYEPGHHRGSSHGATRIFRLAYDNATYVRMAQDALPLWRELQGDAARPLLETTGGIDHGRPTTVTSIAETMAACGVANEILAPEAAAERWPMMRFEGAVCFQPDAGRCLADATVAALYARAAHHGASLRCGEPVTNVEPSATGVAVTTIQQRYEARVAVITAGAWVSRLIGALVPLPPITVTQEQPFHFAPRATTAATDWPSFIHYRDQVIYGLASPGEGVKVAEHGSGPVVEDLDRRSFRVDPAGRQRVVRYVQEWMPGLVPNPVTETTCLYATTPTDDFVLQRRGPLVIGAGFSGHGFKFTPLIGRILADLADGDVGDVGDVRAAWRR